MQLFTRLRALFRNQKRVANAKGDSDPALPDRVDDVEGWNQYWSQVCESSWANYEAFDLLSVVPPILKRVRRQSLQNVLYAGCGISLEPDAFAAAGLAVTALDQSFVAIEYC